MGWYSRQYRYWAAGSTVEKQKRGRRYGEGLRRWNEGRTLILKTIIRELESPEWISIWAHLVILILLCPLSTGSYLLSSFASDLSSSSRLCAALKQISQQEILLCTNALTNLTNYRPRLSWMSALCVRHFRNCGWHCTLNMHELHLLILLPQFVFVMTIYPLCSSWGERVLTERISKA